MGRVARSYRPVVPVVSATPRAPPSIHGIVDVMSRILIFSSIILFIGLPCCLTETVTPVCIIGSGMGGSAAAHFLRQYSPVPIGRIRIFERNPVVGGRMATVVIAGDSFEAGASILHPLNLHASNFVKLSNLTKNKPSSSSFSLGIWDGKKFVFKTLATDKAKLPFFDKIISLSNTIRLFLRYGFSLFRLERFVADAVSRFSKYYVKPIPAFETVEEMLQWSGLYNLTSRSLEEELADIGVSKVLIQELATVITRINYGQSVKISGLAGAVSLAGSGGGLWSVHGGNWKMAEKLIQGSDATLHLDEEIISVSRIGEFYELGSSKDIAYSCEVVVVATPLDESRIQFSPAVKVPARRLQHTHATFVHGILNPAYFGLRDVLAIPELVGTIEDPNLPFSSISVLKHYDRNTRAYKLFSRRVLADETLDQIFSERRETVRVDWGAYPLYSAPEVFADFVLDGESLYYVNAFENAASTMETSAVAAENVVRLIVSRSFNREGGGNREGLFLHKEL